MQPSLGVVPGYVVTNSVTSELLPHVVILGGGFGGLTAARELAHKPVRVTLIDRRNHHLFQPLLYQVATAALKLDGLSTVLDPYSSST